MSNSPKNVKDEIALSQKAAEKKKKKAAIKKKTKRFGYKSYYKIALAIILVIAIALIGYLVLTSESCKDACDQCGIGKNCAACSDTSWAAKYDIAGECFITDEQLNTYFTNMGVSPTDVASQEMTISGGLYRYFVLQVHKELAEAGYIEGTVDPSLQNINGIRADKFIDEKATLLVKQYIVLRRQFAALGYTIDYSQMPDKVSEYTAMYNSSADYYQANGISLESFLQGAIDYDYMEGIVLGARYAKGGYEEYPIEQMKEEVNKKYIAQSYIIQYYTHDNGTVYTDAEKAAKKAEFEALITDCTAGRKNFDEICDYYDTMSETNPRMLGKSFKTIRFDATDKDVITMYQLAFGQYHIFEYDDCIMLMRRNEIDDSLISYTYSRLLIEIKLQDFEADIEACAQKLDDIDINYGCIDNLGLVRFDIPMDY
ncbi:MAG: hypothetical protein E7546_05265 [Ruminococcaceae bacterium]|nr:hypothetical protein [Oscillospiraceae bacterium]